MKKHQLLSFGILIPAAIAFSFSPTTAWSQATVTWTGDDMTWTQPDDTSFDDDYVSGDNVIFDGAGQGTVTVTGGGVTPGNFSLSDGTYNFTGGNLHADSFTLSGGFLQWNSSDQLGSGGISVTGDATIEAMATGTGISMSNPITISNSAQLTITANSNTNPPAGSAPSVGPISGGTTVDPVTVVLMPKTDIFAQAYRLSSSDFTGTFVFGSDWTTGANRVIVLHDFQSDQFGDADNVIEFQNRTGMQLAGASTNWTIAQDMEFSAGNHTIGTVESSSLLTLDGQLTKDSASVVVSGNIRLTNSQNSLATNLILATASGSIEVGYATNTVQTTVSAQGTGVQTLRFVGDVVGESGMRMLANMPSGQAVIDVESPNAEITLMRGNSLLAQNVNQTIVKTGAGTLNVNGNSANPHPGNIRVEEGRMNINGTFSNVGSLLIEGGALGGSGSISFAQDEGITVHSGGTLAPGSSIGVLTLSGHGAATAMGVNFQNGSTFAYEIDSSAASAEGADLLKIGTTTVAGALNLNDTVELTLLDLAADPVAFELGTTFTLMNYTGAWNGGFFTYNSSELANFSLFSSGLNVWQIEYNSTSGGVNFSSQYTADSLFLNITAVPEPASGLLLLGAAGLAFLLRKRKNRE